MIDFKSLGIAFGGAAMVAGLSYLSKRSSAAKAEVSRTYEDDDDIEHLSEKTKITGRQELADALRTVRAEIRNAPDTPYTDEEVEKALNFASKVHAKGVSSPIQRGFGVIKKQRKQRATRQLGKKARTYDLDVQRDLERADYLDNEEAVDALLDLEKILVEDEDRPYASDRDPLGLGALCGSADLEPEECARVTGRLRDAINALPPQDIWARKRLSRDLGRFLRRKYDEDTLRRKRAVDILRSETQHSHWSNLASVLRAAYGQELPEEDLLAKLDELASKPPSDTTRRVAAAITDGIAPEISGMLWSEALAPSYPDLYRADAARVALGEPIQKVFDPVPLQAARKYWKGPRNHLGGHEEVFKRYLLDTCPDFRDETYRDRLFKLMENKPLMRKWLASMCANDRPRFEAFVAKREFPSAPGERRESSYLREIVDLYSNAESPPEISSLRESPKSLEKKLRSAKAMEDLSRYEKISDDREAPVPDWWPEDVVSDLESQGIHLRLLRTCRDVVKEGIDLDNCVRKPDLYCQSVEKGDLLLVSMQIDPQVDEKGATRSSAHRSLMAFKPRATFLRDGFSSDLPQFIQHEGYRGMKVENPFAIAASNALLKGMQRIAMQKG